ncbi:MAG: Rpn family recombination-promoting nuclease/putative transposase [Oscillospiraceae bacterium]|nr:Rpn family recombination-promoting nuclease/putative transposase [Oscillospiraceae bacterium]
MNNNIENFDSNNYADEVIIPKILPPKSDIVFKMLFGDDRNKDILIDFLKAVVNIPDDEYLEITFVDPHLKREQPDDKLGIVDVKVMTKSGQTIHIEIQVAPDSDLNKRIIYYNSKMLVTQIKVRQNYYLLQPVISIAIADFEMIANSADYYHEFGWNEKKTGITFTDVTKIITLELSKVPENSDNTAKYYWAKFLKSESEADFEMLAKNNATIDKAYGELKRLSQDEEAQEAYEKRFREIADHNTRLYSAEMKGKLEGKLEAAKSLLDLLDVETISRKLEIPIEQIQNLKK